MYSQTVKIKKAKMQWSLFLLSVVGQSSFITCHLYQYHYIAETKSWEDAQKYCRQKHTDLATISNMTDVHRLVTSAENREESAWIGLHSQTGFSDTWHWSLPGMEFNENQTEWKEGEPNDRDGKEKCGGIQENEKWLDLSCDLERAFICYDEDNKSHLVTDQKMTWLKAQRFCRKDFTDLASGPEQIRAINKTNNGTQQEIPKKTDEYVFIGLFNDKWRWSDGSSFSFRHWNYSLFADLNDSDRCAMVMMEDRKWKTDKCFTAKPFFCYDDNVILVKEEMNWEDALYYCQEHHHDLVSITDLDEQRWIQEKVKDATTDYVWMGMRYTCTLDFWFWVSDEEVSYENWDSGQTMNDCDMSGAVSRGGGHKWFKRNDMNKFNFLCSEE